MGFSRLSVWPLVPGLALVAACASPATPTSKESVRAWGRPIIGGSPASGGVYDSVGALTDSGGFAYCTATYVGQRRMATAAHCLEGGPPTYVYFGPNANTDASACNGGNQVACNRFVDVASATAHPSFDQQELTNDVAFIVLAEEPGVAAIPMCGAVAGSELVAADEGKALDFVGFGVTNGPNQTGGGVRLHVGNVPLLAVGPNGGIGVDGNQMYYEQPTGGPCNGDSGGPAFIIKNGVTHLAGVTSFGDQDCTEYGVSTMVDGYIDFIMPGGGSAADAGPSGMPDAGPSGTPDAGPSGTPDAGNGGDGDDTGDGDGGDDGSGPCGCRAGGAPRSPALGALSAALGVLGLLVFRRRRRR